MNGRIQKGLYKISEKINLTRGQVKAAKEIIYSENRQKDYSNFSEAANEVQTELNSLKDSISFLDSKITRLVAAVERGFRISIKPERAEYFKNLESILSYITFRLNDELEKCNTLKDALENEIRSLDVHIISNMNRNLKDQLDTIATLKGVFRKIK